MPEAYQRTEPALAVDELCLSFGGLKALDQVSFDVEQGQICGLVGPNGAGKTSLFNCISGFYRPASGRIRHGGLDITDHRPHELAAHGVARTFQHPVLQRDASVEENVMVGGHSILSAGAVRYLLRIGVRQGERSLRARAREILGYLDIAHLRQVPAGQLSYGSQKRVELARALMARPTLLLLDELASGLTHEEVYELGDVVKRVRSERGLSVVLVEHHMGMIAAVTDTVAVLVQGRKVVQGNAREVSAHPVVVEAYLGAAS